MTRSFEVEWSDLGFEAQQNILDSCVETLMEAAKIEGELWLKNDWHDPKPQTWQEAWIRYNAIDYIMWDAYEKREADAEIPKETDWVYWLEEHLRDYAEKACYQSMHHLEIEVEL